MSVFTAGVYRLNILKKLKKELFYAGLSREAYHKVSDAVWDSNRTAIIVWSLFAALFWIMSLVMSLNAEAFKACRTVYIIALIICAVTMVVALFLARRISGYCFRSQLCLYCLCMVQGSASPSASRMSGR